VVHFAVKRCGDVDKWGFAAFSWALSPIAKRIGRVSRSKKNAARLQAAFLVTGNGSIYLSEAILIP
jgi:hypothetical protein